AMASEASASPAAREALRAWYRPRRRAFAWRRTRHPYAVLVSEVMLQQTQAPRVEPMFSAVLERFPTVEALGGASRADVLRAWAGLGYNRRAVHLHEAARAIVREHDGRVPRDPAALLRLPGVGPYTASAVASIAFGDRAAAVDVNVARVVARVRRGSESEELPRAELRAGANDWIDPADPGAWNQALMDLGREICRPVPRCDVCPLARWCGYRASGRTGGPAGRGQGRWEGSSRQARGAVVTALRADDELTLAGLARTTGLDRKRARDALTGLVRDGVVERVSRARYRLPR
ncbi:MAG: A/G-specific adenine glycosylase, partial [Actinomycetota bacterium]